MTQASSFFVCLATSSRVKTLAPAFEGSVFVSVFGCSCGWRAAQLSGTPLIRQVNTP